MSAYRKAVKERDERAQQLGYVPRPLNVPEPKGTTLKLRELLESKAHSALLRRITRG